jgi:hypothetical protein
LGSPQEMGAPATLALERLLHVASGICGCKSLSHLHMATEGPELRNGQGLVCVSHGVVAATGASMLVLALSTNGLIVRISGSGTEAPGQGDGVYFLEWPFAGPARDADDRCVACMALSPGLDWLLCVTRDGVAYGLSTKRILQEGRLLAAPDAASAASPGEPARRPGLMTSWAPSLAEYANDPR